MFFAGLWQRPSPLYCRPRYKPRLLIVWEAAWEDTAAWGRHRIFLAVADLSTHLDISTIAMISRFGITMTDSSAIITTVSSSFLISWRLASLGGTPTTTGTRTITPITATDRLTTPSIGLYLAVSVQSGLAQRGYYHGAIDGEIGSGSRQAIRAFQAAQGLPVTGMIDPKLLKALGIKYRTA